MKILAAAGTASLLATSALASGPVVPYDPPVAPVVAATYNWTGAYVGLRVGVPIG